VTIEKGKQAGHHRCIQSHRCLISGAAIRADNNLLSDKSTRDRERKEVRTERDRRGERVLTVR
jgi:predicted nucleic acid-binding Zn ribbon protein